MAPTKHSAIMSLKEFNHNFDGITYQLHFVDGKGVYANNERVHCQYCIGATLDYERLIKGWAQRERFLRLDLPELPTEFFIPTFAFPDKFSSRVPHRREKDLFFQKFRTDKVHWNVFDFLSIIGSHIALFLNLFHKDDEFQFSTVEFYSAHLGTLFRALDNHLMTRYLEDVAKDPTHPDFDPAFHQANKQVFVELLFNHRI